MKTYGHMLFIFILLTGSIFADSKTTTLVGPGVNFHHEILDAGPWQLFVLEIESNNSWLQFESAKAGDRLNALEKTSSMVLRHDMEEHRVIGAVNADFFEASGLPVGAQILNGMLLKRPVSRSAFSIGENKKPQIDIFSFIGKLITTDQSVSTITGVNETRVDNGLVVYNKYFGTSTGTNQYGTEIITEFVSSGPTVNDTIRLRVTDKDSTMSAGSGNNMIPTNGLILSGHGSASNFLNQHIFLGDTVNILLTLLPNEGELRQLVGGTPRIIRNGTKSVEYAQEGIGSAFASDRHPRTAIGISADSSKSYFFVVDGRQTGYSVGMSLYELADYMLQWGVYQGINLDGGGSSTMIVRGNVVNSPSDPTGERSVSNAMLLISSAPTGPLAQLTMEPKKVFLLANEQLHFTAKGFDRYYNPLDLNPDSLFWTCDSGIGNIASDGVFTAGMDPDSGYVYVTNKSVRDSSLVYVTVLTQIILEPDPVILKVGEAQQITPKAFDSYQNLVSLELSDYQWQVYDSIGTVTPTGLFTATKQGQGIVSATYNAISGTTEVSVGVSADIGLDDFSSTDKWTLTGVRIDLAGCRFVTDETIYFSNPTSGKLNYSLTTGGTSALYLDCNIPLSGSPTAISLMVYGDGRGHWLRAEFQDNDGEKFLLNFTEATPGIDWVNGWRELKIPLQNAIVHWSNPGAVMTFPLLWKRIYLAETDEAKKDSGTIYLDDFKAYYITTEIPEESQNQPVNFQLEQNFPNPFNPETTIAYSIPRSGRVQIDLFDINGQKVESLVDADRVAGSYQVKWQVMNVSSSVYFYRFKFNDQVIATRKMIVLK